MLDSPRQYLWISLTFCFFKEFLCRFRAHEWPFCNDFRGSTYLKTHSAFLGVSSLAHWQLCKPVDQSSSATFATHRLGYAAGHSPHQDFLSPMASQNGILEDRCAAWRHANLMLCDQIIPRCTMLITSTRWFRCIFPTTLSVKWRAPF